MKQPIFNEEGELLGYETVPTYQEQMDEYYSNMNDPEVDNDGPGAGRDTCDGCHEWFDVSDVKVVNGELLCPLCLDCNK